MNEEKLIDALGNIDEKYILETDRLRKRKSLTNATKRTALIAACIALLIISVSLLPFLQKNRDNIASLDKQPPVQENAVAGTDEYESKEEAIADDEPSHKLEQEGVILDTKNETLPETFPPISSDDHLKGESEGWSEGEISTENMSSLIVKIDHFTSEGFVCTLIDSGESIHVICNNDISSLSVGEIVTVYFTPKEEDTTTVYAISIETQ